MEKSKQKVIVVGGPTGSGKTDLAVKIAKEFNGELINADSRQIYRYLDIGTNKGDIKKLSNIDCRITIDPIDNRKSQIINLPVYSIDDIPIHLLSFLNPDKRFDVSTYQTYTYKIIQDIFSRGKLPIIVGGTGLYIDAVIKNYKFEIVNQDYDEVLRFELSELSVQRLQEWLKGIDPIIYFKLNESDKNNPRRLIRAIEKSNSPAFGTPSLSKRGSGGVSYDFLFLFPTFDWEELKKKLDERVIKMFDEGLVEETKKVLEMDFAKDSVALQGIGYKQVIEYLEGKYDLEKCIELVQIAHRQYAKRQRTWFEGEGRNYDLIRVDENDSDLIKSFLNK